MKKISEHVDQRVCIRVCQHKLGETQAETIKKMKRISESECIEDTQIKLPYDRLKEGRTSVERDERSGWLSRNIT